MNTDSTELQNLLRLKRYETPSDEYFDDFLDEFHRRQREDVLKRSARSLLMERVSVWFKELGMAKWAIDNNLHDVPYIKQFTDMPFLVRSDTGKLLRKDDRLNSDGSPKNPAAFE